MLFESAEFSSVQIVIPRSIAQKMIAWGHKIPDEDIFEQPGCGREEEPHITILFGLHTQSPAIVRELARRTEPFTVELTKISLFVTNPKFDVVKIGVQCPELHELNADLRKKAEHTSRFSEYKPHATLAYLKKGRGWKYEGDDAFDGSLFQANALIFSDKDRHQTTCPLS